MEVVRQLQNEVAAMKAVVPQAFDTDCDAVKLGSGQLRLDNNQAFIDRTHYFGVQELSVTSAGVDYVIFHGSIGGLLGIRLAEGDSAFIDVGGCPFRLRIVGFSYYEPGKLSSVQYEIERP